MRLKNCNAESFIAGLNGRKVICFGAGTTLQDEDYVELGIDKLEEYIAFFVDNDVNKHGLKYKYHGHEFDIKSTEAFDTINVSEYVILITCAFYVEIYEQLKDMETLSNIDCYMFDCVCQYPEIDVNNFFSNEIRKKNYREYKSVLKSLNLKDKHKGERCFVIGNGPSLTAEDLELLKDEVTFGVNRIFTIFPETSWRPTYYLCIDYIAYGLDHEKINNIGTELRFIPTERAFAAGKVYEEVTYYNRKVNYARTENGKIIKRLEIDFSEDVEKEVFGGFTVLYDVFQFAVYMGFKEIYLIGVDHAYPKEVLKDGTIVETGVKSDHFGKEYDKMFQMLGRNGGIAQTYDIEVAYRRAKEACDARGIIVKNATRGGKLEVFERIELESLFE